MLPYLLALVAVLIIWFILRQRAAYKNETKVELNDFEGVPQSKSPWHAVSVRVGPEGCLAAKTLEGHRFLAAEAPTLPLTECSDSEACECRFIHYEDRRAGGDRRAPFSSGATGTGTGVVGTERRQGGGRRSTDHGETDD